MAHMRNPANDNVPMQADIRFAVEPRLIPEAKAARRLHLTAASFRDKLSDLRQHGFPEPCPVTGNFDLKAIDLWLDQRSGLTTSAAVVPVDDFERRLAALG